jgi:hypothetical protein
VVRGGRERRRRVWRILRGLEVCGEDGKGGRWDGREGKGHREMANMCI